jgi:hypothetical protein
VQPARRNVTTTITTARICTFPDMGGILTGLQRPSNADGARA